MKRRSSKGLQNWGCLLNSIFEDEMQLRVSDDAAFKLHLESLADGGRRQQSIAINRELSKLEMDNQGEADD